MADTHADISKHVKLYIGVFAALAVLTVLTVAASRIEIAATGHVIVALMIAAVKASLVATVFMHLKWERSGWVWGPLVLCAVLFAALMALPTLVATETRTRAPEGTWDKLPVRETPAYLIGHSGEAHPDADHSDSHGGGAH